LVRLSFCLDHIVTLFAGCVPCPEREAVADFLNPAAAFCCGYKTDIESLSLNVRFRVKADMFPSFYVHKLEQT
jgi:hypothetical protein